MKNLDQLKKHHTEINALVHETKELIRGGHIEENSQAIAKNISIIAGKLQIHLSSEDKFLYPSFINSERMDLKTMAKAYTHEMGDLSEVYTSFKNRYNTRSKIIADVNAFESEAKTVFQAIEKRIDKEDHDLYKIAEQL